MATTDNNQKNSTLEELIKKGEEQIKNMEKAVENSRENIKKIAKAKEVEEGILFNL